MPKSLFRGKGGMNEQTNVDGPGTREVLVYMMDITACFLLFSHAKESEDTTRICTRFRTWY